MTSHAPVAVAGGEPDRPGARRAPKGPESGPSVAAAPAGTAQLGAAPFVGRSAELATLLGLVDEVRAGGPRIALVHGPAGMGKSALLRRFLATNPDLRSVMVSGAEAESLLPMGVVDQLWAAAGRRRPDEGEPTVNHLTAGADLLGLVGSIAEEEPLVVVVDDVQWADGPSVQALVFAARRLVAERLLLVFACRDEALPVLPDGLQRLLGPDQAVRIPLPGLDADELVHLAELVRGEPGPDVAGRRGADAAPYLPPHAAARLQEQTGGVPLHVLALLNELPVGVLAAPDDGPLPAPRTFAVLVTDRLAGCSLGATTLARAASVLGLRCRIADALAVSRADAEDGDGSGDDPQLGPWLDELTEAGLVEVAPSGVELAFPHPLVQSAIYHGMPPGQRSSLHLAAAAAAGATDDEATAMRHRVDAALGQDPAFAEELAGFAAREAGRSSWSSAAHAYLAASRLHDDPARQDGYLMLGAESLMLGGDGGQAVTYLPRILEAPPSPKRGQLLGFVALMTGDHAGSQRLSEEAWDQCHLPEDRDVAAKLAAQLAMVALNEGRSEDVIVWCHHALDLEPPPADEGAARAILASAHGELGRFEEGHREIGSLPNDPGAFGPAQAGPLLGRGVLHLFADQPVEAVEALSLADEVGRRGIGHFSLRINSLLHLADAEYRLGQWDRSAVHAELATSLGSDTNAVWTSGLAHSVASFAPSGRGEWERAEGHVAEARAAAHTRRDAATRWWLAVAEARLAQARGDAAGMVAAMGDVLTLGNPDGSTVPGVQPWKVLYGEGLAGVGRLDEAAAVAADLRGEAERHASRRAEADSWRLEGLVAGLRKDRDRMEVAFERAVATDPGGESADGPRTGILGPGAGLATALIHLDYGSALRRVGSRRFAVDQLEQARAHLLALSAAPFLDRCHRELAACGSTTGRAGSNLRSDLTAQEMAVATLVASGLTNREIAGELVVSVKTVEYHLGNAFRKLGVTSRSMLTARVLQDGVAGPTTAGA